ncbi:hypothetical protein [Pontibacter brevis]
MINRKLKKKEFSDLQTLKSMLRGCVMRRMETPLTPRAKGKLVFESRFTQEYFWLEFADDIIQVFKPAVQPHPFNTANKFLVDPAAFDAILTRLLRELKIKNPLK